MFRVRAYAVAILATVSAMAADQTEDPTMLQIERERVAVEREKLALEGKRLAFEQDKQKESTSIEEKKIVWAAVSAIVPILAALATLWYSVLSLKRTVNAQLRTKIAELALGGSGSHEIVNRAKLATDLFGELLPSGFIDNINKLDPSNISAGPSRQAVVLQLLAAHPAERDQILADFKAMYGNAWIDKLMGNKVSGKARFT